MSFLSSKMKENQAAARMHPDQVPASGTESGCGEHVARLRQRLNDALLGKRQRIELVLACLLARGHLLLDDLPGTGKTTLAKTLADCLGGRFGRLQCTPDLLPTDITGFNLFNQKSREFEFHPGPVFSDVLLADEINRTTPRTQSALLEAMAERQVTIDAVPHRLADTFFVIATQNPIDSHGAYPLPEAQLDRFAMRLEIGYPDREAQLAMLAAQPREFCDAPATAEPKLSLDDLRELQRAVAGVAVHPAVQGYLVDLIEATRRHESIELGASPRGMLSWQRIAQAWAFLKGREFVTPQDVQDVAGPVLSVRLVLRSGSLDAVIKNLMTETPVPDYR
ncbi:MAG: MoxR family ATPase [Planctomycetaceae bacterium]|nr:MAG: MoxR family ATPase [Planctomycetaceae bacterium]